MKFHFAHSLADPFSKFLTTAVLVSLALEVQVRADPITFSNFEPPTYTSNTLVNGVDGWVVQSGNPWVTPAPSVGRLEVLEGVQSMSMGSSDSATRLWNSEVKPVIVTNGTFISWLLLRPEAFGNSIVYFSDNVAGAATPAGLQTGADGNFHVFATDGNDTGVSYQTNHVYRMGMHFDFAAATFAAYAEDLTAATPRIHLGTYTMFDGPKDTTFVKNNGGLFVIGGAGVSIWDDFQMIPEPSVAVLLSLGGLLIQRRKQRGV